MSAKSGKQSGHALVASQLAEGLGCFDERNGEPSEDRQKSHAAFGLPGRCSLNLLRITRLLTGPRRPTPLSPKPPQHERAFNLKIAPKPPPPRIHRCSVSECRTFRTTLLAFPFLWPRGVPLLRSLGESAKPARFHFSRRDRAAQRCSPGCKAALSSPSNHRAERSCRRWCPSRCRRAWPSRGTFGSNACRRTWCRLGGVELRVNAPPVPVLNRV